MTRKWAIAGVLLLLGLGVLWALKRKAKAPASAVAEPEAAADFEAPTIGGKSVPLRGHDAAGVPLFGTPEGGTDGGDVQASETLMARLTRESAEAIRRHDAEETASWPEKL